MNSIPLRVTASLAVAVSALVASGQTPAYALNVSAVVGSAYGYRASNIVLFGTAQADTGPAPTVTLASDASNSPQSASVPTAIVQYGPAVVFTADAIDVHTSGSLGSSGSATSSTNVQRINKATTQPHTGSEIFTADNLAGTCSAAPTGVSRTTTITNGMLETDNGVDQNGNGSYSDIGDSPPVFVPVPTNPAPNATYDGTVRLNGTTDSWRVVFNEFVAAPDGSAVVNPVHEYFLGPTLTGDLVLGRANCGVRGPVAGVDSYKAQTILGLSVAAPGVLANDVDPDGGPLTAALVSPPSHGTVTLKADGSFTYSPALAYLGPDTFTYRVTDAKGFTDTGLVAINVTLPLM